MWPSSPVWKPGMCGCVMNPGNERNGSYIACMRGTGHDGWHRYESEYSDTWWPEGKRGQVYGKPDRKFVVEWKDGELGE